MSKYSPAQKQDVFHVSLCDVYKCVFVFSRSAWSVGTEWAVAAPLTIVSAARWENWVTDLNKPLASGGRSGQSINLIKKTDCVSFYSVTNLKTLFST